MSLPEQAAILAGQLCLARNGHQYRDRASLTCAITVVFYIYKLGKWHSSRSLISGELQMHKIC